MSMKFNCKIGYFNHKQFEYLICNIITPITISYVSITYVLSAIIFLLQTNRNKQVWLNVHFYGNKQKYRKHISWKMGSRSQVLPYVILVYLIISSWQTLGIPLKDLGPSTSVSDSLYELRPGCDTHPSLLHYLNNTTCVILKSD